MNWTTEEGLALCKLIEPIAVEFGFHVALAGGLCTKEGPRKDCDIILYIRTDQGDKELNLNNLYDRLTDKLGFTFESSSESNYDEQFMTVAQAAYKSKPVDLLIYHL